MPEKGKILVFGAAGFIGTYLIDELIKKYDVIASDISKIGEDYYAQSKTPYIYIDITKPEEFKKIADHKIDTVIHLAAMQPANFSEKYKPSEYINVNVVGTMNILGFCKDRGVKKIIYASSHRNTSGLWHLQKPIQEKDGRAQQYDGEYAMFSISESAAQDCVQFYGANYGIQDIIFRLPPVYGFGPHLEIFKEGKPIKTGFQTFIENAIACKPLEIWGDTNVGRDIIYVKDVVSAFLKAIEHSTAKGLYNITSGYRLTLQEEVETIAKVFWGNKDKPVLISKPEKKHTMDSFVYDNSKAKKEFAWEPKYNFEQMLHDYRKEKEKDKFSFLVKKRQSMFKGES